MEDQVMSEEQVREIIRNEFQEFLAKDKYIFNKKVQFLDGKNIQLANGTGTKIGTETTQKLGFFNTTPVIQASAISAPSAPGGIYSQAEAASAVAAINSIRTALKNIGITA